MNFDCIKEILQQASEQQEASVSAEIFLNLTQPIDQKFAHHYRLLIEQGFVDAVVQGISEFEHDNEICGMIIGTARSLELEIHLNGITVLGDRLLELLSDEAVWARVKDKADELDEGDLNRIFYLK